MTTASYTTSRDTTPVPVWCGCHIHRGGAVLEWLLPMQHESEGVLYFNRNHVSLKGADLLANKVIGKVSDN
jgi:hypothetical protein